MVEPEPEQQSDFNGKIAIVTGGAVGLGLAAATALANRGAKLIIVGRDPSEREPAGEVRDAVFESFDLLSADAVNSFAHRIRDRFERIDILANLAAVYHREPFLSVLPGTWDAAMGATLRSTFFMSQAVAREMISARTPGAIVNFASDAAFQPAPMMSIDSAARGGIVALSRTMAYELAPHHIRVNVVAAGHLIPQEARANLSPEEVDAIALPASIRLHGQWATTPGAEAPSEWLEAAEVAPAVVFLASEAASGMTGACINVNRGTFMPH